MLLASIYHKSLTFFMATVFYHEGISKSKYGTGFQGEKIKYGSF